MTIDYFKSKIETAEETKLNAFADEIMATTIPWFFKNEFGEKAVDTYDGFKTYMAKKFDVPSNNIFIVGSALLGFSLSPKKNYKAFDDTSDIDIVIVDEELYKKYWDKLFDDYSRSILSGDKYTKIAKDVFKRFIDTKDRYYQGKKEYIKLKKQTDDYAKDLQIKFHFPEEIGYRIYKSFNDYKINLIRNFIDLKYERNAE